MAGNSWYGSLIDSTASFAGVDQGIDFTGPGTVYALADGTITRLLRSGSGWPGQGALLVYHVDSGPEKGRNIYVAEDFNPGTALKVGDTIKKGDPLGQATGSGAAPGIETGWADATGHAYGSAFPRQPTKYGKDFEKFVFGETYMKGPVQYGGLFGKTARESGGVGAVTAGAGDKVVTTFEGVTKVGDALSFLFSYRGLEVIGGGLLIIVGIVGLMREVGVKSPSLPGPAGTVATATGGE